MLIGRQLPIGALRPGVDAAAELAERGVGIDRDHAVVLAQFGENRTDAGRDRRLADSALAHHADLVVAAQHRPDLRLELGLAELVGRRAEVHQPEGGLVEHEAPAATRRDAARRHQVVGADPVGVGAARRRRAARLSCPKPVPGHGWPQERRTDVAYCRRVRVGAVAVAAVVAAGPAVVAAVLVADPIGGCRGGSEPTSVRCRGAFPAGDRIAKAGGNYRLAGPGPGREAGRRRCVHPTRAQAAPDLGRAAAPARRRGTPFDRVRHRRRARRSRQEAARAPAASVERAVPVRQSPARSWFPLGLSSRDLSAMRHRGRSLLFSSGGRATRLGLPKYQLRHSVANRMRRSRVAGGCLQQTRRHSSWTPMHP